MTARIIRIIRNVVGALLVVIGLLGIFLPFLQGILLIILGIALMDFPGKKQLIERVKSNRHVARARRFLREISGRKRDGQ